MSDSDNPIWGKKMKEKNPIKQHQASSLALIKFGNLAVFLALSHLKLTHTNQTQQKTCTWQLFPIYLFRSGD